MGNMVKVDISEESFNKLNSIYIEAENFIKNFKREDYVEKVVVSTWGGYLLKKLVSLIEKS